MSAGVSFSPWGWDVREITLGDAVYKSGSGGGVTGGIEGGAFVMTGRSWLLKGNRESCRCE